MGKIEKYCRKLKSISIFLDDYDGMYDYEGSRFYTFLSSYGRQLEYAAVPLQENSDIEPMVRVCENARFKVYGSGIRGPFLLRILKHKLVHLIGTAIANWDDSVWEERAAAWDLCTSLEIFNPGYYRKDDIRAVMNGPKRKLKHINISLKDQEEPKNILDLLASNTGALESLSLVVTKFSAHFLNNLLRANPSLSLLKLGFHFMEYHPVTGVYKPPEVMGSFYRSMFSEALEVVKIFVKTSNLKHLEIKDLRCSTLKHITHIADVCVPYRHQRLHVNVFGVVYLK